MRKFKLDMEDLAVDSFDILPKGAARGTVVGHVTATHCGGEYTIDYPLSCDGLCGSYKCTDEFSCAYTGCGDCTNIQTCQANPSCGVSCIDTCFTCPQHCE